MADTDIEYEHICRGCGRPVEYGIQTFDGEDWECWHELCWAKKEGVQIN